MRQLPFGGPRCAARSVDTCAPAALFALSLALPATAAAQTDLAGEWGAPVHEDFEHRIPGPALGDYTGLPLNDAGRLKARTWDASILSQPEQQARPHPRAVLDARTVAKTAGSRW